MTIIPVPTAHPYEVCIQSGCLAGLGAHLRSIHKLCTVAVISDDTVFPLYGDTVCASLRDAGYQVVSHVIPHGESAKNLTTYAQVLTFLATAHLNRGDLLIALGGGVVGDLTGFAAATYQRGIPYVQVPTTLLAAVDSSVGGKTAVDLSVGKNLVGAFHQPALVWCDPDALSTLPEAVFRDGWAEVLKYGLLADADFFRLLRRSYTAPDLTAIIARCVEMKRDIVAQDEFDRGARQLLNLGHTFGHAIEAVSGYTLSHGHCVAMGMAIIARAAAQKGLCPEADAREVADTLSQCGLPTTAPYPLSELSAAVLSDKKIVGRDIALVVPFAVGSCALHKIPAHELHDWLQAGGVQ